MMCPSPRRILRGRRGKTCRPRSWASRPRYRTELIRSRLAFFLVHFPRVKKTKASKSPGARVQASMAYTVMKSRNPGWDPDPMDIWKLRRAGHLPTLFC
jgi:hypothetical protein